MKALLREPLLHFLLIGTGIFVVYGVMERQAPQAGEEQIVVPAGRIRQLATVFAKAWQRPPTEEELRRLVDDFVLEEIYYRQAVAMGIDRDDTIIRRRLRQKFEFLTDDATSRALPSETELEEWLQEHPDAFREPSIWTFRQVYINPDKHPDDLETFARAELAALAGGAQLSEHGDASLLPVVFTDTSARELDARFGPGFAQGLSRLPHGEWTGPVQSGYGLHLVCIEGSVPGRLPALDEIRPAVEREWSHAQRVRNRREMDRRLREQYEVVIEWPETDAPYDRSETGGDEASAATGAAEQ